MVCMVVADSALRRTRWQYTIEDLGEEWRCIPVAGTEQAMGLLADEPVELLILCGGRESGLLLSRLTECPPIAPPWLLGDGLDAPDGTLRHASELPALLAGWRSTGRLPALAMSHLSEAERLACALLTTLQMPPRLRAWAFLPDMAALTVVHPPLLTDLAHTLYPLTARRHSMTPAGVERSLRLCVESIWSRGSITALERFFGHSVDPERGKPTNREFLCRIQERLTFSMRRLL